MTDKGLFITLEGGEGAGKTTQIQKIIDHLNQQGIEAIKTREPGGTQEAEKIRDLLVQRDGGDWSPEAETLLFFAARHMHCKNLIWPAIEKGAFVICDRFTDSTRAYQSYAGELDHKVIDSLENNILSGFKPDLTFILDIDPEIGLKRSLKQNQQTTDKSNTEDRFERKGLAFHTKIRNGFLDIANKEPNRCYVIDATQDIETITNTIITHLTNKLKEVA